MKVTLCIFAIPARLSSTHRGHHDIVAAASTTIDLLAGAELQVLTHANANFTQPLAVASDRDRCIAETGIGFDEGFLDICRRNRFRIGEIEVVGGNFHRCTRLANGLEISALAKARTEVADYCCLYRIPLTNADTLTPFSLACVDAALAAGYRLFINIRQATGRAM